MLFYLLIYSVVVAGTSDTQAPILDVEQEKVYREKFYALSEAKVNETELLNPNKKRKKSRSGTTAEEYQDLIKQIEIATSKKTVKTQKDYYLFSQYEILVVGDTKKIIKKR
ncbi:unnamed protein product [Brachionus calyciflorus]|uniref:Uncharacterized protein n=1 Tax=Brachionus calyciflorus TaxID=104777 RepID=A0A813ZMB6_9BILA|nr:unnamed protein product [Brachionus calyciflorus]